MNKEVFIFSTIVVSSILLLLDFSLTSIFLIFISTIFIYLSLKHKNRHIGLPTITAVFTILVILYLAGLIGKCHVCTTDEDGVIFFCNRLIKLSPSNYDAQLNLDDCNRELIWIWPKKNN